MERIFKTCVPARRSPAWPSHRWEKRSISSTASGSRNDGGEKFEAKVHWLLGWYKRITSVTDQLSQEVNAGVQMSVRVEFHGDCRCDQFQTIRDVLDSLGIGKVAVDGQTQPTE